MKWKGVLRSCFKFQKLTDSEVENSLKILENLSHASVEELNATLLTIFTRSPEEVPLL
jgi:hypothetical protein